MDVKTRVFSSLVEMSHDQKPTYSSHSSAYSRHSTGSVTMGDNYATVA